MRNHAVEDAIARYRRDEPGIAGRACLERLKAEGLKVGSDRFWKLWKKVVDDDPNLQ